MEAAAIAIANRLDDVKDRRIADLKAAIREMIEAIPGGQSCDPQRVADTLRAIAERHSVSVE